MPRKTKESDNKLETVKNRLLAPKKISKSKDKETLNSKKEKEKKKEAVSEIKKSTKKSNTKKEIKKSTKKSTTKKASMTPKQKTSKKDEIALDITAPQKEDVVLKANSSKKSASLKKTKKESSKSISSKAKKATKSKKETLSFSPEYYDLPYRYNQTVVKILAQTPTNLFIYWEISDKDRENLKKQYGKYFFEITKPVLVVHNKTMNYSFEIDINDFANSWYLHVNDSDCEYKIELGRRPIPINYNYIPQYDVKKYGPIKPVETSYIYISSSNELQAPNDHILFNNGNKIYFRNIKTNQVIEKDIKNFPFIYKNNQFINIYELYKNLYNEEFANNMFDLRNPSSGNPTSGSLSSKFK